MSAMTFDTKLTHVSRWQQEGRVRVVKVSTQLVFALIKDGMLRPARVLKGLPDDAVMVGAGYDNNHGTHPYFTLYVASSEFEPAVLGLPTPEITVTFQTIEEAR